MALTSGVVVVRRRRSLTFFQETTEQPYLSSQHQLSISISINTTFRFSEDDPNHHDHHQEPQEDGGYPPSMGRFLTTIFHLTPQVLYIFRNLWQNPDQPS